jgi:hypothetical protein
MLNYSNSNLIYGYFELYKLKGVEALPDYSKVSFPDMEAINLATLIPNCQPEDIQFIEFMLKLCPEQRLTCAEVCYCRFF